MILINDISDCISVSLKSVLKNVKNKKFYIPTSRSIHVYIILYKLLSDQSFHAGVHYNL